MRQLALWVTGVLLCGNLAAQEIENLIWELGYPAPDHDGEIQWVPSAVPGAVQPPLGQATFV